MSGFGIEMVPAHLVLDSAGRALITERGLPAPDARRMLAWITARVGDVETLKRLDAARGCAAGLRRPAARAPAATP